MDRGEENQPFIPLEESEGGQRQPIHHDEDSYQPPQQIMLKPSLLIGLLMFTIAAAQSMTILSILKIGLCQAIAADPGHKPNDNGPGCGFARRRSLQGNPTERITDQSMSIPFPSSVVTAVVIVPLAIAAQRIGKKTVLVAALASVLLAQLFSTIVVLTNGILPKRLLWLSSALESLVGGYEIMRIIALALATNVVPRQHLLTTFLGLNMIYDLGHMAPAGLVLPWNINPLITLVVGLFSHGLIFLVAKFIDEEEHIVPDEPLKMITAPVIDTFGCLRNVGSMTDELLRIWRLICRDKRMIFVLVSMFLSSLLTPILSIFRVAIPVISLPWAIPTLIISHLCYFWGCCGRSISPLSKALWLARVLAILALPAAVLFGLPIDSSDPARAFLGFTTMGAYFTFQIVLSYVFIELQDNCTDTAALLAVVVAIDALVTMVWLPLVPLVVLAGSQADLISLIVYSVAIILLFCIWPRAKDKASVTNEAQSYERFETGGI
ncbi:hypothetical protein VHEMI02210 [[Torrubiella] hemipterigena]|uniref:Uncharacterized protein n=1 Tax=[Torrubiella] hemipterigena TaxID=1531966 RepID=A0A0A1T9W9_9HYPO|nr:hypothetical protein VHEMI02210 [[Torrubiella] hemipterigena]